MRCIYCGEEMRKIKTSIKAYWGNYELEIKGVEPYKCSKCEHEVYAAEEAKMIQDITKEYADFCVAKKSKVLVEGGS